MPCCFSAARSPELSLRANSAPCTFGCNVFTRPSIISGKPVTCSTRTTGTPSRRSASAVPPVETISQRRLTSSRANSTIPRLSDTERRALLTSPLPPPAPFLPGSPDLLIEERVQPRTATHAPQCDVAVVGDVADDVADLVEPAVDEALGRAAAQCQRDVADAIPRAAGQQGEQRIRHGSLVAGDGCHSGETHGQAFGVLQREHEQQQSHPILLASSRTTCGSNRCSASKTRAASLSGVSPGSIRTRSCAMIAPRSKTSSTKCTVAPDAVAPPASTTSCASPRAVCSSFASFGSRKTVVGTAARRARSSAPALGRLEITRATRATGEL